MKGKDIKKLIPQRDPIILLDELIEVRGEEAVTGLVIRPDNYFVDKSGRLEEAGMIEHIAQSASALAGYEALAAGATTPPVGYIGEVKNFHYYRYVTVGEELRTTITKGVEVNGVTMMTGETRVADEVVADTRMKISIKNE